MEADVSIGYCFVIAYIVLCLAFLWLVTRHKRSTREMEADIRNQCDHEWWPARWTQGGWTRVCKRCNCWDYLGDSFDERPDDAENYGHTGR